MALAAGEEKKPLWKRLIVWDLSGCSHSVKIRKACLGGDYKIGGRNVQPYFSVLYKIDDKLSLQLNKSIIMFQRKMTASVGGASLDFAPHIGLRLDERYKPDISVRLNNLRPLKLALSCMCIGIAFGLPVRTAKAIPIKKLAKEDGEETISRLDCELALGVERQGLSLNIPCTEINGVIRLGSRYME